MVQQVQLPDGNIGEFPDEMPREQIAQVLQQQFPPDTATRPPRGGDQQVVNSGDAASPAPSTPADPDPFADIPTEIDGVTLSPDLREAISIGRTTEDPKEKRILAARIAGRIAAQSEGGNLADQITRGQFGAGLRGFANGIFGLGDATAAATQALTSDLTFGESLEMHREFRRALEGEFPITSGLAEVAGAVTGGGLVLGGAKRLVGGQVAKVAGFQQGQKLANVARAATAGGLAGGVTEEVLEGEGGQGAILGAVGGPLGLGVAKAATVTFKSIKNFLADPGAKGIKALAKNMDETPEEMARRFLEFEAVTGAKPAIVDIANPQAVAELRDMIALRTSAVSIAREGAEDATRGRAADVAEQVAGGRVTATQAGQEARRTRRAIDQFAEAEDDAIEFSPKQVIDLLSDPDFRRAMPISLKRRLDDILGDVGDGQSATLSGLDVNDIRLALRDRARGATGADRIFGELANEVEAVARAQSPAFGRAIDEFASRSVRGEGVAAGRKVLQTPSDEFELAVKEAGSVTELAGRRVGARSAVAAQAAKGSSQANTLSKALAEDSGLVRNLRAILPAEEVDRLQEVGKLQTRSAENVTALAPGVQAQGDQAAQAAVRDTISAIVVASGNTGGAFKASVIAGFFRRLLPRNSQKTIDNLARDAFDPAKTDDVIRAMRRGGVSEAEILGAFAGTVAGGQQVRGASRDESAIGRQ